MRVAGGPARVAGGPARAAGGRARVAGGPARAAWRAKAAVARASLGRAVAESVVRVSGLAGFGLVLAVGTFLIFRKAFAFLHAIEVVGPVLVARLLSLFFFMLFVMLVLSNVLVAFQTLYRSREADFWALAPISPQGVLDARMPEVGVMASWAFLVLGTPLLLAYGAGTGARPAFLLLLPVVLVAFAVVAHALGVLAILVLVRLFPGLDFKRLAALLAAVLVPVGVALVRAFRVGKFDPDASLPELLVHALEGLGRTRYPFLPGYWAGEALRAAAQEETGRALFFCWALVVTATFLVLLARAASGRLLVPGFQLLRGRGIARPALARTHADWDRPSRRPFLALSRKDWRTFRRDPMQWSQVGLVALLALVYVVNLRQVPSLSRFALWGSVASYLNAGVVMLLLATLATRFAFPLISLEGRRAWIVMLAPLPRTALLTQKVLLALPLLVTFGAVAVEGSARTLGIAADVRLITHAAVAASSFALAGLAVGLGALFPNFREDNPARIVSGFGGTLCFLLGMAHVGAVTLLLGAPSVLVALRRLPADTGAELQLWALAGAVLLSAAVGAVPIALGRRRLSALEM